MVRLTVGYAESLLISGLDRPKEEQGLSSESPCLAKSGYSWVGASMIPKLPCTYSKRFDCHTLSRQPAALVCGGDFGRLGCTADLSKARSGLRWHWGHIAALTSRCESCRISKASKASAP